MGRTLSVLFHSELLVLYEKARIVPDTWYDVINCVDNL